jgi:hypothetical protein
MRQSKVRDRRIWPACRKFSGFRRSQGLGGGSPISRLVAEPVIPWSANGRPRGFSGERVCVCPERPFDRLRANGFVCVRPFDGLRANGFMRRLLLPSGRWLPGGIAGRDRPTGPWGSDFVGRVVIRVGRRKRQTARLLRRSGDWRGKPQRYTMRFMPPGLRSRAQGGDQAF